MKKSTIGVLYLITFLISMLGFILYGGGAFEAAKQAVDEPPNTSIIYSPIFYVGILLLVIGGILALVAWIGVLVKTAFLGRWGWFFSIFFFPGIALLVYIFFGPTSAKEHPAVAPHQAYPQ
jgi:hypothetical protein